MAIQEAVPGASLEIVGDGECRAELEAVARGKGLQDAVTFHGNVSHDEVLRILSTCHVFVFPTRVAEGFPKAVLEAMACGLPVLVPRVSVLPLLVEGGAGRLLDGTAPSDVAAAVIELAADPENLRESGKKAREKAREFTLERWQHEIRSFLEEAWSEPLRTEGGA